MKIKLLLAALCMLSLPMWFSSASGVNPTPAPLATVAIAGHTLSGGWCACGCPGCICDPEEQAVLCGDFRTEAAPPLGKEDRTTTQGNEFDFGSSVMFIALALFAWSRMRA